MNSTIMTPVHSTDTSPSATDRISEETKVPELSARVRHLITVALIFEVLLLSSIGGWLWWGMHQYQNIR